MRSAAPFLFALVAACGGAGRPVRAVPDAAGTYAIDLERTIPPGASWDEHAVSVHEERQVTRVLGNEEVAVSGSRVELLARVTHVAEDRRSMAIVALTVDDGSGARPLVPTGATLEVTRGDPGVITSSSGPLSPEVEELVRRVVRTGDGDDSDQNDALASAFLPAGGRAAVGQSWTFDDAALARYFSSRASGATVRREDVGGQATLREGAPWEGHDCLDLGLELVVHDMTVPVPAGTRIDDVELRLLGTMGWPLDLDVPSPRESMRMDLSMALRVESPEAPGVVVELTTRTVDTDERIRSGYRAP